jgi:hypothetical protein
MEITPKIKAYFEVKDVNFNAIDNYFTDDIRIENTGENDTIQGFGNCKKWLKEKNQQYEMKTKVVDITADENGTIKVSVLVSENFVTDYYFTITNKKMNVPAAGGANLRQIRQACKICDNVLNQTFRMNSQ